MYAKDSIVEDFIEEEDELEVIQKGRSVSMEKEQLLNLLKLSK